MNKYSEIMSRVSISDSAMQRILAESRKIKPGSGGIIHTHGRLKKAALIAACFAVAVFAFIAVPKVIDTREESSTMCAADKEETDSSVETVVIPYEEYGSAEELSQRVGFNIADIAELYERANRGIIYAAFDSGIAEISYYGDDVEILLRKAVGGGDISGDYEEYEYSSKQSVALTYSQDGEEAAASAEVTLKGDGEDRIYLATWENGGYAYSIECNEDGGMTAEEAIGLAKQFK